VKQQRAWKSGDDEKEKAKTYSLTIKKGECGKGQKLAAERKPGRCLGD